MKYFIITVHQVRAIKPVSLLMKAPNFYQAWKEIYSANEDNALIFYVEISKDQYEELVMVY